MKRKALIALIISTCVVVVGCVGLVFWAFAATQVTVKSSLVVSYKPTPQVVCETSATYQKTTDATATPFQTGNLEFVYGGPDTTRNIEASSDALQLDDTDTYLVTEYTFTNKNDMDTYDLTIRLTDNAICTNMARKYYFGNDIAELSVSAKKDKIINSGVDNLSLSTQKLVLGYQETGRIYMLLQITPGIVANYNSDNTNLFLFRMTCAERGTEVAYLSKEWPSKVGSVSGVVTFTKDVSKIAGLANNVSVGTNSETDTSAFVPADGVEDVTAYWGDTKSNIVIYSPATIYAPQDCSYMFSDSPVTEINFDNFNTSKVTDMSEMFREAPELVTLDVSGFDTSNVTDMSGMFSVYHTRGYYCNLTTLILGENFNTSKVTDMSWMFANCNKLTALDVSNFDTSNVGSMYGMFNSCSSLTSLKLGNFNPSKETTMQNMFCDCLSLTSLDVSNIDTSNVTDMQSMFSGCSSLTSLDVSNFDTSKVTTMRSMFSGCSSLTSLDVSNIDTSNVTDMQYMFSGCTSLTSLNLGNFDLASCTSFGDMLARCSALASITLPYNLKNGNTIILPASAYFNGSDGAYDAIGTETSGTTVACSTTDSKVTLAAKNVQVAFLTRNWTNRIRDDSSLNTVTKSIIFTNDSSKISGLSNSVSVGTNSATATDAVGIWVEDVRAYWGSDKSTIVIYSPVTIYAPQDCSYLFTIGQSSYGSNFSKLTNLDLTNFNTSNVITMEVMFSGCPALTSLDASNFDTSNVTSMVHMFYNCSKLTSLDVSSFNTSKVTTMSRMFSGCTSLTSLDVSNFDTSNVTAINELFGYCKLLTSLDVSNIDTSNVTDMQRMFSGCSSLTSLDVSNFDTSNVTDMSYMFSGCSSLTSLNLGNFNLASCNYVNSMLSSCSALASIILPYNLKSGKTIALPVSAYYNGSDGAYDAIGTETSGTTVACSTTDSKVTLAAKNVQVAFLTRNWTNRIRDDSSLNTVTKSIIFTNDSSKISGLSNSVSVGTNSATATDAVGIWVEDVRAYWGSDKSTIVIYSPVTIYAPQDCSYLFTIGQSSYGSSSRLSKLSNLDLTNFDTSKVKDMKGMFYYCSALTSLDVSNFDTSNVTAMNEMFRYCSALTSLDVSNFNTSNVTAVNGMFEECRSIKSLDVSNFDTSNVTVMDSMFSYCKSLTSLNLGNFNLASCNNVNGMLSGCSALASITLPYNLKNGKTTKLPTSTYYNGSAGPYDTIGTRTSGRTVACSTASNKVTLTKH